MLILILVLLCILIFMCGVIIKGLFKLIDKLNGLENSIAALPDIIDPPIRAVENKPAEPVPQPDEDVLSALKRAAEFEVKLNEGLAGIMNYDIEQARAAVSKARKGGIDNA
jgi:predicted PurR-regulated permease PerM